MAVVTRGEEPVPYVWRAPGTLVAGWVRAAIAGAMIIVAMFNIAGCAEDADDISAVSMPRAEVWRVLNENLHAVDSSFVMAPYPDNPNLVKRLGCATDQESWMSEGPPWRYRISETYGAEDSDRLTSGIDALARKGFEVDDDSPRRADPRDVYARDSQGFALALYFNRSPGEPLRLELVSSSPCVRHPNPAENTL